MSPELSSDERDPTEKQLDAGTWGVFFVWLGVALIAQVSIGTWLLGVGAIVLGEQLVRRLIGLRFDGFWIGVGALAVAAGAMLRAPFGSEIALVPALSILVGLGLVLWALLRRARPHLA